MEKRISKPVPGGGSRYTYPCYLNPFSALLMKYCDGCNMWIEPEAVQPVKLEWWDPTAEKVPGHTRFEAMGSGIPGVYGCRTVTRNCGPVRDETDQEYFLRWALGER